MQVATPDRGKLQADSYLAWWRDTGVDYLCANETVNWLEQPVNRQDRAESRSSTAAALAEKFVPPSSAPTDWPFEFAALMRAIGADAAIPGNAYGRQIAAPVAADNAELMVLCDFPDEPELAASSLGSGTAAQLLKAMVTACGYDIGKVHVAALAHSRPASGALPEHDAVLLADFARHHIGVVKPERLLLLGSSVCEILTGQDLAAARANLRDFNHDGRNMAAVATFHPRTLLARPILKAQAWHDLRVIVKKDRS